MQLSVKDAAHFLNVSEKTIYRWIKREEIPVYRINQHFRFNRAELLEWATSRRIEISPELFAEPEVNNLPLLSLTDGLKAGGVVYGVGGRDKRSVLRAVVDVLDLPPDVDREFLYQVLLGRETLGSTGAGDGIAIPHVRHPVVLHVPKPTVTLCFFEHPIDFRAFDGRPVNTLFVIISPTVRAHLQLLSRLGFVLRDPGFKAALKRQGSRDELMEALSRVETTVLAVNKNRRSAHHK